MLRLTTVVLVSLASTALQAPGRAQEAAAPTRITLYPATATRPALANRLLPGFLERIDGNAIVYLGMVKSEQNAFFGRPGLQNQFDEWKSAPLTELRDVQPFLKSRENGPLYYLDQAARSSRADWQLPIGRVPYYSIMLPNVQESREFARLLAAHARIAMAHGDMQEPLRDFQTGFALAQHLTANETLVSALVGMAVANVIGDQVLTFIQQPDAPNLYWPLTQLPPQLVDLRRGVEAEMHGAELTMTELQDLDSPRSADEWRETLFKLGEQMADWTSGQRIKLSRPMITASVMRAYPAAKRALMERGYEADAVAKMPVAQVILLNEMGTLTELRDDAAKWFFLPYPDAVRGLEAADKAHAKRARERRTVLPLSETFLPAMESVRGAQVRCDRMLATLRVLEALRIYAAAHEGRLPAKLSDVTEAPVPVDPVTMTPFGYSLKDGVARLQSPTVNGQAIDYEIRMEANK